MRIATPALVLAVTAYLCGGVGHAHQPKRCSFECQDVKVRDGDTLECVPKTWPKECGRLVFRVKHINTPESLSKYAKCKDEELLGLKAKERTKEMIPAGSSVRIKGSGKLDLYNRVLADVEMSDGRDFGQEQIRLGLAVPYEGGTKSSFCNTQPKE
ncbi:MAG: thermonuclease family protein [Rhizobiaceae bacterium]